MTTDSQNPTADPTANFDVPFEAAVAAASVTHIDELISGKQFNVINLMEIHHRARFSRAIVARHLRPADLQALTDVTTGRKHWHFIPASQLPYDGTFETTASLGMGVLGCVNARPFTFMEGDIAVARHVKPQPGKESFLSTAGTVPFTAHIDHAWSRFAHEADDGRPLSPDYLVLAGHINDCNVETEFCEPGTVLQYLDEETQYYLERPEFTVLAPPSVQPARKAEHVPAITRDANRNPYIRLNPRMEGETDRAHDALATLWNVLDRTELWTRINLQPGDVVIARGSAIHQRGQVTGPRHLAALYGRDERATTRVLSKTFDYIETL